MGKRQNSANIGGLAQNAKANVSGSVGVLTSPIRPYELWHSGGAPVEMKNWSVTITGPSTSNTNPVLYVPTTDKIYTGVVDGSGTTGIAMRVNRINPYTKTEDGTAGFVSTYNQDAVFDLAYSPVNDSIYFFHYASTAIEKINPHTMAVTNPAAPAFTLYSNCVYCPVNSCIYVNAIGGRLAKFNPSTDTTTFINSVQQQDAGCSVLFNPFNQYVYLVYTVASTTYLDVFNPATDTVVSQTTVSGLSEVIRQPVVSLYNGDIYFLTDTKMCSINHITNQLTIHTTGTFGGNNQNRDAYHPQRHCVYFCGSSNSNTVWVFNTIHNRLEATVSGISQSCPVKCGYHPKTNLMYLAMTNYPSPSNANYIGVLT